MIIAVRDQKISAALWDGIVEEYNLCSCSCPPPPSCPCQIALLACFVQTLNPENVTFHNSKLTCFKLPRDPSVSLLAGPTNVALCYRWWKKWEISKRPFRRWATLPLCVFYQCSSIVESSSKRRAAILKCSSLIIECLLIILWFRAQRTHLLERLSHFPGEIEIGNFTH